MVTKKLLLLSLLLSSLLLHDDDGIWGGEKEDKTMEGKKMKAKMEWKRKRRKF